MDRITDRPDMTSAVYHGHKAPTQTNPNKIFNSGTASYHFYWPTFFSYYTVNARYDATVLFLGYYRSNELSWRQTLLCVFTILPIPTLYITREQDVQKESFDASLA